MPKLGGHRPVFQVYGPKLRLKQFPKADWRFLVHTAGNVARAFATMHVSGLVIGDVNHGNLFVAADATVRFIDADSMQVGRWPCEVGVSTHQPPEMQGLASYRGVVRTPNHDSFGLAVLVFQLLCMGRHPFSGRYAGPGEPPDIEQAITQSRYAYSADTNRTGMSPPPGSLPIAALPGALRGMFEAAFAPGAAKGGRPTAEQWAVELAALGRSLKQCGANAAHWFAPAAAACPWCEVEARSGVVLFPAVFVPGRSGSGIALLWQQIEAVPEPGPMPDLPLPDPASARPSPRIRAAARRLRMQKGGAVAIAVLGLAVILAAVPAADEVALSASVLALAACVWWLGRPAEVAEARANLAEVRALWSGLVGKWKPGPGARFTPLRRSLAAMKGEHDGMAAHREAELRSLAADRRRQQLQAHLESHEIASAKIPGVGKAKVATLLSYGIETAADIEEARITAIAGFGPRTAANMLAFRQACEAAFRFDANRSVEPARIAAMDGMLAQRRAKIEAELAAGLAQLRALVIAERRHRDMLAGEAAELRPPLRAGVGGCAGRGGGPLGRQPPALTLVGLRSRIALGRRGDHTHHRARVPHRVRAIRATPLPDRSSKRRLVSVVLADERLDPRGDLVAEAGAVEQAVMADAGLLVMLVLVVVQVRGERMGGAGLPQAGDVVPLAFHRQDGRARDRRRVDVPVPRHQHPARQQVLLEHGVDGLQVELGRQVHDRAVFVIERPLGRQRLARRRPPGG